MTVLSQTSFRANRTDHMVTAHSERVISVGHTNYDGYLDATTHLTVEEATKLRDLLTEALALYPVEVEDAA